jgi:cytochrome c peroxidase
VPVLFSSNCAILGTSHLDAQVDSKDGMAAAVYQPRGCALTDTITATVGDGVRAIRADLVLMIGATKALSAKASLGYELFYDKQLSASGTQACASCHSPVANFLAPNQLSVPVGGVSGTVVGFRSAPSAAYAALIPPFSFLGQTNQAGTANNGINGKLGSPRRGLMWDGRAATLFEQARGPLTGAHEMANANSAAVLAKLLSRPYADQYRALFGALSANSNADAVLVNIANAIGQYETEDKAFLAFNSKFDAVQKGLANFTAQEANGQALFSNRDKGACAGCHNSDSNLKVQQGAQLFSDLSYRVLAVPRNWKIPYNNDATVEADLQKIGMTSLLNGSALGAPHHKYYDLGFCGPFRTDSLADKSLCGAFRVPSLRNVALKGSYFHNGVFGSLSQVINFYMNRDANPRAIYTKADGSADIAYNDLPLIYQANRELRPPFEPLRPLPPLVRGGAPRPQLRLSALEVQDLVAFLCTLSDGYDPQNPGAYNLPAQCRGALR